MAMAGRCIIRAATEEDCEQLSSLIQEEHALDETKAAVDANILRLDGFGKDRLYQCFVAVEKEEDKLIGYALYLFYYFEFNAGTVVFLENVYVSEKYKHEGSCIEQNLTRAVAGVAAKCLSRRMYWTRSRDQKHSNVTHDPSGTVDQALQENIVQLHVLEDELKDISTYKRKLSDDIVVREARPEDCPDIVALMISLTIHEGQPPSNIQVTAEDLRRDGFGQTKRFSCHVAEDNGRIIGHVLYFPHYSARDRVSVFLQDIFVLPEYRGRGVGSLLFQVPATVAVQNGYKCMIWRALANNEVAMRFYMAKGATNCTEKYETHYLTLADEDLAAFTASETM